MRIRKATKKDLPACAKMSRIPEFTYLYRVSDKKAVAYLKEYVDEGFMLVAEEKGRVMGFMIAEPMLGSFSFVDVIVVAAEMRGKGIGKKLFQETCKLLKKEGVRGLYLVAPKFNKKTLQFY